jgi:hypothetical protein
VGSALAVLAAGVSSVGCGCSTGCAESGIAMSAGMLSAGGTGGVVLGCGAAGATGGVACVARSSWAPGGSAGGYAVKPIGLVHLYAKRMK